MHETQKWEFQNKLKKLFTKKYINLVCQGLKRGSRHRGSFSGLSVLGQTQVWHHTSSNPICRVFAFLSFFVSFLSLYPTRFISVYLPFSINFFIIHYYLILQYIEWANPLFETSHYSCILSWYVPLENRFYYVRSSDDHIIILRCYC